MHPCNEMSNVSSVHFKFATGAAEFTANLSRTDHSESMELARLPCPPTNVVNEKLINHEYHSLPLLRKNRIHTHRPRQSHFEDLYNTDVSDLYNIDLHY